MDAARQHYSGFTLTVHWLTVVLVLTQIAILWISKDFDRPVRGEWMMFHKSLGLIIGMITLIRLAVRTKHPAIPLPAATPGWQRFVARATHVLLYTLLVAMPLVGWIAMTAMDRPVQFFWLFEWPAFPFVAEDKKFGRALLDLHEYAGKTLIALIVLHILGGLKHYFVDRDGVLQRMLPFLPARTA